MSYSTLKRILESQAYKENASALHESTSYKSKDGDLEAKVYQYGGKHKVRFFVNGEHRKFRDYEGTDENDAHEFAKDEIAHHEKNAVNERIDAPQGHVHYGDPISDDSKEGTGHKKKMMGQTDTLVATIAKILLSKKG